MNCKVCNSPAQYVFEKTLTRPDFNGLTLPFYQCPACGFLFSTGFDALSKEEMDRFYAYPEYLKYDPSAVTGRRDERTVLTVEHVKKRFGLPERPKVLLHGNGTSHALFQLWMKGYDVYATHAPFTFPNCITTPEAIGMEFDIVCAIEVLEHFVDPYTEFRLVEQMLKNGGIFCGTTCLNTGITFDQIVKDEWHYIQPHTLNAGHCSMWSERAFDEIALAVGMKNLAERGTKEMRERSHMPATSVFFQFQKP